MNEKIMIRAAAIFSMLVMALFGTIGGVATYNLFGLIAPIIVAAVMLFIIWRIWVEAERMIEYRDRLYWEGVEFTNPALMQANPRNVGDAQEVIKVLKQRILDLDDARSEAVAKYYAIKEERDSDAS